MRELVVAGFPQHEVHAFTRRLFAHELRLLAVFGVDDLVFAVLVTVRAAQVALIGDIQHHGGEREVVRRHTARLRPVRHAAVADGSHAQKFADAFPPTGIARTSTEFLDQFERL